jgi:hypothetical protein
MKTWKNFNEQEGDKRRIHLSFRKVKAGIQKMANLNAYPTQELDAKQYQPDEKKVELPKYLLI